ncbi:NAD-dependent dehydratase, partial [Escherichia coli]|nr:NAD-dependent dehydratase [Escherichia coli]
SKELGIPLRFPGKPGAYDSLLEMTDAGLLARATVFIATNPASGNQAYNINNGDLVRWSEMWPKIARFFDLEVAPPLPMSLNVVMADKEPLWDMMVRKHGLADIPYKDVSSWGFGDAVFGWNYDFFADG